MPRDTDVETPRNDRPGFFEEQPARPRRVRGYWFNRAQHPDTETDGTRVVPRWDPLRYDKVASLPDPPLEAVPEWRDGVFGDAPAWSAPAIIGTIAVGSYAAAEGARLFGPMLSHPHASILWVALLIGLPVWALREGAPLKVAVLVVPVVPVAFVLVLFLSATQGDHRLVAEVVALVVTACFVDRFTDHAVQVAIATGALPPLRRLALRNIWMSRWRMRRPKPSPDAERAERIARRHITFYPVGFLFFGLLLPVADWPVAHRSLILASGAVGFVLFLRGLLRPGLRRVGPLLRDAATHFIHYGRRGSFALGVLRSPAGERPYRLAFLAIVCVVVSGTFVPRLAELHDAIVSVERGPAGLAAFIAWWLVLSAALPIAVVFGGVLAVTAPVLGAVNSAADGSTDERTAAAWAFAVHVLRASNDETVRGQLLWGLHGTAHYPVLVPVRAIQEHVYIAGGSGAGKTSRALLPLTRQVLGVPESADRGPVLVVDLKGDEYLFQSVREAAAKAGRRFRFFTNRPGYTTHAFNPVVELRAAGLPLADAAGPLRSGLNLEHGAGYGKSHFSAVSRGLLRDLFVRFPGVRSLRELHAEASRTRPILSAAHKRREEQAYELMLTIEMLADIAELNVTSGPAFDERIDMNRAVLDDEVIYFFLSAKPEEAVARFVGSLAVETFFDALARYNDARDGRGERANTFKHGYAVLDEFQAVAGRNFEAFMEIARGKGLGLVLASQVPAKLPRELRIVVEENVAVRQHFTTRSVTDLRDLLRLGGTTMEVGIADRFGEPRYKEAPRLTENVLKVMSAQEDLSLLVVQKSCDYAQFDGFPVVVRAPHADSRRDHEELMARPWPVGDDLVVVGAPLASAEEEPARVIPLRRARETAATGSETPVMSVSGPTTGTELERFFSRIVVGEDSYSISTNDARESDAGSA